MAGAKAFVDEKINSKPVVVFSKTYCPFCKKAKTVLEKYGIPADKYEVIEMDGREDCEELQDYLKQITGARSIPRVFIGGKCVGGGNETAALDSKGELASMLKDVQALG